MKTTTRCDSCIQGPAGESGHGSLVFQVEGPYPGHHIFRCTTCDERWIRQYGTPEVRYAWTRYSDLFETRTPKADPPRRKVAS